MYENEVREAFAGLHKLGSQVADGNGVTRDYTLTGMRPPGGAPRAMVATRNVRGAPRDWW